MNHSLDKLQKIKQVEAPPFLLTRIQARLQSAVAPAPWKWAFAAVGLVVLTCNLAAVLYYSRPAQQTAGDISAVVGTLHLSVSNELYHE